jgi:hypothetical protein
MRFFLDPDPTTLGLFDVVNHLCQDTEPLLKLPGLLVQCSYLASQFAELPVERRKTLILSYARKIASPCCG